MVPPDSRRHRSVEPPFTCVLESRTGKPVRRKKPFPADASSAARRIDALRESTKRIVPGRFALQVQWFCVGRAYLGRAPQGARPFF